jgi:hypothetical protein
VIAPTLKTLTIPEKEVMLQAYRAHAAERAALGIPPLPLDAKQVADLIELIKNPPAGEAEFLLDLLTHRVPPGVDDAAKVKASFLAAVAHGDVQVALISKARATELLGTMVGGYNVHPLIELLDDADVAGVAAEALKKTLLMFDYFNDVAAKAKDIVLEVVIAVGHADRIGSAAYNQKLSEKRAMAVKEYLVAKGIPANRVYTEGKGSKQPVTKPDQCKGAKSAKVIACLQPDRRVDIELIGTKK